MGSIGIARAPEVEQFQPGECSGRLCYVSVRQRKGATEPFMAVRSCVQGNEVWKEEKRGDECGIDGGRVLESQASEGCLQFWMIEGSIVCAENTFSLPGEPRDPPMCLCTSQDQGLKRWENC